MTLEEFCGVAYAFLFDFFGSAGSDDLSTVASSFGPEVDDIVGCANDVGVVLNDDDGVAAADKLPKHLQEDVDVFEVESGGGLVEDVDGAACVAPGKLGCEFDALAFAAGEGCGWLSKFDIAQAYILQGFDFLEYGGLRLEESDGLVDGHVEHVGDGLAFVADFERLAVVTFAVTGFTGHGNVGQEVHFNSLVAVSATGLTASSFDVKGEPSGSVAANLGFGQSYEQASDIAEDASIGCGVASWRATNWTLVDTDDFVNVLQAVNGFVGKRLTERAIEAL